MCREREGMACMTYLYRSSNRPTLPKCPLNHHIRVAGARKGSQCPQMAWAVCYRVESH